MKKSGYILLVVCISVMFSSCKKAEKDARIHVNFPAAYVINGEDHSISVINLITNKTEATLILEDAEYPHHIYLSPDGSTLAVGVPGTDLSGEHAHSHASRGGGHREKTMGQIILLDAVNGKQVARTEIPFMVHNAVFSPSGKEVWCAKMEQQGEVLVFDSRELRELRHIPVGSSPLEVTISADGTRAFVANSGSNTVTALDMETYKVSSVIPVGENPVGAWPAANNRMYVDNEGSRSISEIDVASQSVIATLKLGYTPAMTRLNALTGELWVSDAAHGKVHFYKKINDTWTVHDSLETGKDAHAIAFSKEGTMGYVTNQGAATLSVIDARTHTKISDVPVGNEPNGIVLRE